MLSHALIGTPQHPGSWCPGHQDLLEDYVKCDEAEELEKKADGDEILLAQEERREIIRLQFTRFPKAFFVEDVFWKEDLFWAKF